MLARDTHTPDSDTVARAISAALDDSTRRSGKLTKEIVDTIREQFPASLETLKVFFSCYFDIRAYDRVEQIGKTILQIDPADFAVRLRIIRLLTERRKTAEINGDAWAIARAHLEKAESQPDLTRKHWVDISVCYIALRDHARALQPALKAVEMSDGASKVSARLTVAEVLLAAKNWSAAGRELKQIKNDLSTSDHFIRAALLSQELGVPSDALDLARRAAVLLPPLKEVPNSYVNLGRLFFRQKALEDGRAVLRSGGFVSLENGGALRRLHDVCFDLGLNDLAMAYGVAALEILTDDYALYERVQLLKVLQKHPTAATSNDPAPAAKDVHPIGRLFRALGKKTRDS